MLFDLLIFVMNTEEFILIPETFYKQNNSTYQVLKDSENEQKAKSPTLLQRKKTFTRTSPADKKENIRTENFLSL